MVITATEFLVWIIIALAVGILGELLARRRAPDGIIGAAVVGFLAIFILVGVLHIALPGDISIDGVPLISSILVAALFVILWSRFAYHRVRPYASRYYYRRGTYARRPRRRYRWF